jgi:hypothetical protein
MGTGGPFPGGKARPVRDADHSPHLVPTSIMSRSYTSSPHKRLHGVKGTPVPIVLEVGWAPKPVWTKRLKEKILSPLPGIKPRSPGRPVRSQTLYWLSYPGSFCSHLKSLSENSLLVSVTNIHCHSSSLLRHTTLSSASLINISHSRSYILIVSSHLCLRLQSGLFFSRFPINILYASFIPVHCTYMR